MRRDELTPTERAAYRMELEKLQCANCTNRGVRMLGKWTCKKWQTWPKCKRTHYRPIA